MRGSNFMGLVAAASLSTMSVAAPQTVATLPTEQAAQDKRQKEMRRAVATGTLAKPFRSRGPQAKPKKRPNRNTISKRVRRKHRRAA